MKSTSKKAGKLENKNGNGKHKNGKGKKGRYLLLSALVPTRLVNMFEEQALEVLYEGTS